MIPSARLDRPAGPAFFEPDAPLTDDRADARPAGGEVGGRGEQQLVVLAVVKGVLERRAAVALAQLDGIVVNGNARGVENRAYAALSADARQVARQAVAEVDHGRD